MLHGKCSRNIEAAMSIRLDGPRDLAMSAIEFQHGASVRDFQRDVFSAPCTGWKSPAAFRSHENRTSQKSATHHSQQTFCKHLDTSTISVEMNLEPIS